MFLSILPQRSGEKPVQAVHESLSGNRGQFAEANRVVKGQVLNLFGQELEQVDLWDGFLVHGLDRRLDPVPGQVPRKVDNGGTTANHVVDVLFKLLIIFESFKVVLISQSPPALVGKNCVIDNFLDCVCDGFCQGVVTVIGLLDVVFLGAFAAKNVLLYYIIILIGIVVYQSNLTISW